MNWKEELKRRIGESLNSFHIFRSEDIQKLKEHRFLKFSSEEDDILAVKIIEEENSIIRNFIIEKNFSSFIGLKNKYIEIEDKSHWIKFILESELENISKRLYERYFDKLSQSKFEDFYRRKVKEVSRNIKKSISDIMECYRKSYETMISSFDDFASKRCGYLSVAFSLERLNNFWRKDNRKTWMKFNEVKIGGSQSIQLKFCEYASKQVDFFNNDYSFLEILKSSKYLDLDSESLRELYHHYHGDTNQRRDILRKVVNKICSENVFRNRGGQIYNFLQKFLDTLLRGSENPMHEEEFIDIYRQFIVERAIIEYEIFRVAVNNMHLCLPKVCVWSEQGVLGEIDLLVLKDDSLLLVEVTMRRDHVAKQERLLKIKELLEEEPEGISSFELFLLKYEDGIKKFTEYLQKNQSSQSLTI